jgi:hypothetical protein
MATELTYLAWAALLTSVLWITYIVGQVLAIGFLSGEIYIDPTPRPVPLWAQRANRKQINSVETLAPFDGLISIIYLMGIPYLRTMVFSVGFIATLGVFYEVVI